jgi:hypothetical protein
LSWKVIVRNSVPPYGVPVASAFHRMWKLPSGVLLVAPEEIGRMPTTPPLRTTQRIWRVLSISMCRARVASRGLIRLAVSSLRQSSPSNT